MSVYYPLRLSECVKKKLALLRKLHLAQPIKLLYNQ